MKVTGEFNAKRLNKDKLGQIYVIVSIGKFRKRIPTGIYIDPRQWDAKKKRINAKHPNKVKLNAHIDTLVHNLNQWKILQLTSGRRIEPENFLEFLDEAPAKKDTSSFNEFFYEQWSNDPHVKPSTYRDQSQTYRLLELFRQNIPLDEIDKKFIIQFDEFMTTQGLAPNTRGKHHKTIKKYLRRAIEFKLLRFEEIDHPYYRFKIPRQKTAKNFLSPAQLEKFENTTPREAEAKAKDLFLWACYTGMRFGDSQRFNPDWVVDGKLTYTPQKTENATVNVVVPIGELFEGKALELLKRNNNTLPKQTIQEVNRHLKSLCAQAGIDKHITFHCGRHTFLTIQAFRTGNLFKVMRWGGLTRPETAMVYIHLAAEL